MASRVLQTASQNAESTKINIHFAKTHQAASKQNPEELKKQHPFELQISNTR
jgi:hypothetical protein